MSGRPRLVTAVDPGSAWRGFAELMVQSPGPCPPGCLDHSTDLRLHLLRCHTYSKADELYDDLSCNLWRSHRLVLERFRLYPWMARQQGFSEFGTAECLGVCKYIADKVGIPYVLQDPAGNMKDGRQYALQDGFKMVDRKLGSGKYTYYGPDFDLPGKPHRRDAAAHAVNYAHVSGLLDTL